MGSTWIVSPGQIPEILIMGYWVKITFSNDKDSRLWANKVTPPPLWESVSSCWTPCGGNFKLIRLAHGPTNKATKWDCLLLPVRGLRWMFQRTWIGVLIFFIFFCCVFVRVIVTDWHATVATYRVFKIFNFKNRQMGNPRTSYISFSQFVLK